MSKNNKEAALLSNKNLYPEAEEQNLWLLACRHRVITELSLVCIQILNIIYRTYSLKSCKGGEEAICFLCKLWYFLRAGNTDTLHMTFNNSIIASLNNSNFTEEPHEVVQHLCLIFSFFFKFSPNATGWSSSEVELSFRKTPPSTFLKERLETVLHRGKRLSHRHKGVGKCIQS